MKINELWVAYAGSQLTCTVTLHHFDENTMVKVIIGGVIDEPSAFITNVILAAMDSGPHEFCLIDVQNLVFVTGISINEQAIECLIRLTGFAMNRNMRAVLVVDDAYVREVLADTLRRHRGFNKIMIQSSQDYSESGVSKSI
ncbi:MAG: hypothetical protein WCF85_00450 [Rhodospirillaceae bacterium]